MTCGRMSMAGAFLAAVAIIVLEPAGRAQAPQRGAAPAPAPSARSAAPIDLTGYWVSIVNEDWRWRMVTPPKGDYASVPLNDRGRMVADTWQPSMDGQCDAYGAAGLMRMPTRVHITWENDEVLRVDTDAGAQTRRFVFGHPADSTHERTLQGVSTAEWQYAGRADEAGGAGGGRGRGGAALPHFGSLKVVTTQLLGGWLRRNGVPYSENTVLTEYYDRFRAPTGDEWFFVTTVVHDPMYLQQDFITSSHFRKEPDGAKWNPMSCRVAR